MEVNILGDRSFTSPAGEVWECFSPKVMERMYPEGGYRLLGEIISKPGKRAGKLYKHSDGRKLELQPLGTYKKPVYGKYAYIWCEDEDGFIVVKKRQVGSLLAACLLIAALAGLLVLWTGGKGKGPNIDQNAGAFESKIKRPENLDESRTLIPGYDKFKMYEGTDKIYMALLNPKDNPCYFQYDIVLDETGETLFSTELIPPGSAVTEITLPKQLKKGEYPITVRINSYSLDDYTKQLNGGESKTSIVVFEKEE